MYFLSANKIQTTSTITVDSGTGTAGYLFNRNPALGWFSVNYNASTNTTIGISFSAACVISHIVLQNHNLARAAIYASYMGSGTTNVANLLLSNSATSSILSFNSITASAVSVQITDVMGGADEYRIGELIIAEKMLEFERAPAIKDYAPQIFRKQVTHEMPDGGVSLFNVRDKYRAKMSWDYVTQSFRDSIFDLFRAGQPLYFFPNGTSTGWDGLAYEVQMVGGFDFEYSSNVLGAGFSGSINIQQTPSG